MGELKEGIKRYFMFYNTERFHQSLLPVRCTQTGEYLTPEIMYESFSTRKDLDNAA